MAPDGKEAEVRVLRQVRVLLPGVARVLRRGQDARPGAARGVPQVPSAARVVAQGEFRVRGAARVAEQLDAQRLVVQGVELRAPDAGVAAPQDVFRAPVLMPAEAPGVVQVRASLALPLAGLDGSRV